jgi:septal ring factor EnvC (AmiA/AmiB activator)
MKTKTILTALSLAACLVGVAHAGQEQLAQSIKDARIETSRTHAQLQATLDAINKMTKQKEGDLRPAYNAYCAEVGNTESAAVWTKTRIQWMAGDGRHYFQDWQATIGGISNEGLKKKSQKRLDSAQASYNKVEASLQEAGEKFKPFLSDLGDIKTALAADVTAGGVKSMKGTVRSANWNSQSVDRAIQSALKEMSKMEKALSTQAN